MNLRVIIKNPRIKPWLVRCALFAAAALPLWGAYYAWGVRGWRRAEGDYLTAGGQSYIVIKSKPLGRLEVTEGGIPLRLKHSSRATVSAHYWRGRLFIDEIDYYIDLDEPDRPEYQLNSHFVFEPSASPSSASWDLISGRVQNELLRLPAFLEAFDFSNPWREIKSKFSHLASPPYDAYVLPPSNDLNVRFLLRLKNEALIEYVKDRKQKPSDENTLETVRQLARKHPDAAWLKLHNVELEAVHGSLPVAERLWADWESAANDEGRRGLDMLADLAHSCLAWRQYRERHPDIPHVAQQELNAKHLSDPRLESLPRLTPHDWGGAKAFAWFKDVYEAGEWQAFPQHLIPPVGNASYLKSLEQSGLKISPREVKKNWEEEELTLATVQFEIAFPTLAGQYILTRSNQIRLLNLNSPDFLARMRSELLVARMEKLLENAELNATQLLAAWHAVENLNGLPAPKDYDFKLWAWGSPYSWQSALAIQHGDMVFEQFPVDSKHALYHVHLKLLSMALAERYAEQMGVLDESTTATLKPLMPELPEDPYAPGQKLKFRIEKDEAVFYSVGPDGKGSGAKGAQLDLGWSGLSESGPLRFRRIGAAVKNADAVPEGKSEPSDKLPK